MALKAFFPMGLSDTLRLAFPDLPSVEKPLFIPSSEALDPYWIAGFANGDGSFALGSEPSNSPGSFKSDPCFSIGQHARDEVLLNRVQSALRCGYLTGPNKDNCLRLQVTGISKMTDLIVPFFTAHILHGAKALDFRDFCKGVTIINSGGHRTKAGMQQLITLHRGMNSTRTSFK